MHSSFILDSTAATRDLIEASAELIHKATTLHRLILLNCFDENGQILASHELLSESFWIAADFLNDATEINDVILQRRQI